MTKPYLTILSTIRAHYSGEEVQGPCVDEAVGLEALPGGSGGLLPIREAALGSLGAGDPRRLLELPEDKPPRWFPSSRAGIREERSRLPRRLL